MFHELQSSFILYFLIDTQRRFNVYKTSIRRQRRCIDVLYVKVNKYMWLTLLFQFIEPLTQLIIE